MLLRIFYIPSQDRSKIWNHVKHVKKNCDKRSDINISKIGPKNWRTPFTSAPPTESHWSRENVATNRTACPPRVASMPYDNKWHRAVIACTSQLSLGGRAPSIYFYRKRGAPRLLLLLLLLFLELLLENANRKRKNDGGE